MRFTQATRKKTATGIRIFGGVLLVGGIVLCFTGIGLIFGLPGAALGIYFLTKGDDLEGTCPYCDRPLSAPANASGVNCSACKKRSVVDDTQFRSVD